MKLTPTKKKIMIWTFIMTVPIGIVAWLMAWNKLGDIWGGIIFIVLMLIVSYGNYRITRKPKEVKHGL